VNTITRSIGRFEFGKDVPLSHAKLIADTVQGDFLMSDTKRVRMTNERARELIRAYDSEVISKISFVFYSAK